MAFLSERGSDQHDTNGNNFLREDAYFFCSQRTSSVYLYIYIYIYTYICIYIIYIYIYSICIYGQLHMQACIIYECMLRS